MYANPNIPVLPSSSFPLDIHTIVLYVRASVSSIHAQLLT